MGEELPPRVRQQLVRVQQTRDSLQYVTALVLQVKQQLAETKNALEQVKGLTAKSILYQAAGPLLFKTTKQKATTTLSAARRRSPLATAQASHPTAFPMQRAQLRGRRDTQAMAARAARNKRSFFAL